MRASLRARFDMAGRAQSRLDMARAWLSEHAIEGSQTPVAPRNAAAIADISDSDAAAMILEQLLAPLAAHYTHVDVEEIVMNRPGEVWLRNRRPRNGQIWEPVEAPQFTYEFVSRIVRVVANVYGLPFDENDVPCVYASLPGGHRFTAAMGKILDYDGSSARGGMVLAIRQAPRKDIAKIGYESYGLREGQGVEPVFHVSHETEEVFGSIGMLRQVLKDETHVLISGGTGTGKTTLLDRMLEDLPKTRRVGTVEDTRELRLKHPNRFHIVLPRTAEVRQFDEKAAKDLLTRLTPDVIIGGELSTRNAALIYNLTGTGHGAMMTTIHAESPQIAVSRFVELIQDQKSNADAEKLSASIRQKFLIIQLHRSHSNVRSITAIIPPEKQPGTQ